MGCGVSKGEHTTRLQREQQQHGRPTVPPTKDTALPTNPTAQTPTPAAIVTEKAQRIFPYKDGDGVVLSVIEELLSAADFKNIKTTEDVCHKLVKPQTTAHQCAYIGLLDPSLVGPATCFISHAWKYNLEDCVDVMREHEKEHPGTYFWFDLVVNNQHKAVDYPFEWWCSTFQKNIEKIGTMVLVLSPWSNPIPLKRSWCLFEIMCAMNAGNKVDLQIRLPSDQKASFVEKLHYDHNSALKALMGVKTEESEAFSKSDRDNIFRAVEASIGFHQLNAQVNDQMRNWFIQEGEDRVTWLEESGRDLSYDTSYALICSQLGNMVHALGDHARALELYEKALPILKLGSSSGEDDDDIAIMFHNMANAYDDEGDYAKALKFYDKSLTITRKLHGEGHHDMGATYMDVADVYCNQGNHAKALEIYEKSLTILRKALGEDHPDTAKAYSNMAGAYCGQGDFSKGLELLEKSLATCCRVLGEDHPDTAETYGNMASVYRNLGDFAKALEYFKKDLAVVRKVFGENHPATATTYFNMGNLFLEQSNFNKALEVYEKSLSIRKAVSGEDHPDTASVYSSIARVWVLRSNYAKALEVLEKSLATHRKVFGEGHPGTAQTYYFMAVSYEELNNSAKALEVWEKAYSSFLEAYGPTHEDTIDAKDNLEDCKKEMM